MKAELKNLENQKEVQNFKLKTSIRNRSTSSRHTQQLKELEDDQFGKIAQRLLMNNTYRMLKQRSFINFLRVGSIRR